MKTNTFTTWTITQKIEQAVNYGLHLREVALVTGKSMKFCAYIIIKNGFDLQPAPFTKVAFDKMQKEKVPFEVMALHFGMDTHQLHSKVEPRSNTLAESPSCVSSQMFLGTL